MEGPWKVLVTGICGRMGRLVAEAIASQEDMELVGGVDRPEHAGEEVAGVTVESDLAAAFRRTQPQVMVDFTVHEAALRHVETALFMGVAPVVGTTGFTGEDRERIAQWCQETGVPAFIAPNFAIGAVLMMEFAARAARYFDHAEILELHHEKKRDAPSGTALKTAEMMLEARGNDFRPLEVEEVVLVEGARGACVGNVRIHSLRLPGLVAHQEVILGGPGQTLSLRHDTTSREAFLPGVLLAVRKVWSLKGLVYGLENLLD